MYALSFSKNFLVCFRGKASHNLETQAPNYDIELLWCLLIRPPLKHRNSGLIRGVTFGEGDKMV